MPFPETRRKLKAAGYSFVAKKTCPCGAPMELWQTPNNVPIPMNPMVDDDAPAVSHFFDCPKAAQFRRAKPSDASASAQSPERTPPPSPPAPRDPADPPSDATPSTRPGRATGDSRQ